MAFLGTREKKQIVLRGIFQVKSNIHRTALWLLDVLLPPKCLKCAARVDSAHAICPDCWKDVQFLTDPRCAICGYPFGLEMGTDFSLIGESTCGACQNVKRSFSKAVSALRYDDDSRQMIIGFKHHDRLEYVSYFTNLLKMSAADLVEASDMIVPVPLHPKRLIQRRYNQSALLSRKLASDFGKAHEPSLLERTKNTPPQQGNINKRSRNVQGAFKVGSKHKDQIRGKSVLLIDDVYTTGATVENCAKALKRAGAANVYVATVFRVVSPQQRK